MLDAIAIAPIYDVVGRRHGQPDDLIGLSQQHQATIAADLTAFKIRLDQLASDASKLHLRRLACCTLWHAGSPCVIGLHTNNSKASSTFDYIGW